MTEEDYFAAAYEEELAMEEEARQAEAPAAAPMDAEPTEEADKPKGVFDWRERDDFGKRLVPEESRAKTVHDRRKEQKLQAPGAAVPDQGVGLLRLPPHDVPSVPVTLADGSRRHAAIQRSGVLEMRSSQLLSRPVGEMLREIDEDVVQDDEDVEMTVDRGDGALWVDRYAPTSFPHLLSDERTNRDVLRAIKDWDPHVFRKAAPAPPRVPQYRPQQQSYSSQRSSNFSSSGGRAFNAPKRLNARRGEPPQREYKKFSPKKDKKPFVPEAPKATRGEDGRPLKRVILLAGEPGTGKTTLAHVLARQAGYSVREVNASDERSAAKLEDAVRTASSNRTLSSDRPTLLVLDELDGADGQQAVACLVRMAQADLPSRKKNEKRASLFGAASEEKAPTKKRKGPPPLRRPVICVCNDLYAPSLRQLRDVALVFQLRKPTVPRRLAQRLRTVADSEGVASSPAALATLADAADGDVRAAIGSLQFAVTAAGDRKDAAKVTKAILQAAQSATKDRSADEPELFTRLFKVGDPKPKKINHEDGIKLIPPKPLLVELAQSSAQRIVDGVLENYGKCERRQPDSLDAASKLLDDLSVADQFIGTAFGKDCFSALPYAAASAGLSAHSLYSVDSPPLMKRPTDRIFRAERQKHSSALSSLDDSRARYGGQLKLGCSVLALDVCASLRRLVLKPGSVRPVNPDLLRQPEREALDNAAGRLAANGLTFERDMSFPKPDEPPRPFKFRLRPDVASVSLFADAAEEPLSDVLRQTLARKVLVEKARRRERAEAEKRREQKPIKKRQSVAPVDAETLLKKAAAKVRTPAQPQRRGFSFSSWQTSTKRAPPPKATAKRKAQEQLERAARPAYAVQYKFKKGHTNAVRREVTLEDLLA